ncbi:MULTISPECIES: dephospho-CoA kinase [Flavobacterium]|uniref:Dephospho-CoA kinase n=2 Tax=Flavobacterium TaxID=237 RepID=A0A2N9PCN4_9FLAO|nr:MULTISPECIES: dephospho-CoA kinase [Flavobacterium]QYS89270.1 dephospho-CoA kinase [Flavobacterium davisii]RVU90459.1 dephospho-CoA kinase [Flavobacterium columnare]SPE78108.1 Dephospho-CoA kinase [Flavobacterium columnare]
MTKIIGLTGGIGSGKTTVARLFQNKGIPVYIADEEARKIMALPETVQKVASLFGEEVLKENKLNRKQLGQVVFNDPSKLKMLNELIHPLVAAHFYKWIQIHNSFPFVIKESAILFESESYKNCDKIILVIAPEEERIKRVMQRDQLTKEAVLQRIKNQLSDEEKIVKSDFVIKNENLKETSKKISDILKFLSNLYQKT